MKETNALEWANQYPEVVRWLSKLQIKTKNAFSLYRFCQWCNKTPSELLKLKENPASRIAEKLLDDFVAAEIEGYTNAVKFNISNAVKSFFKHNYADLSRACGTISLEKVKPYNKPRKEDLRKLWSWASNPRDKALITFVCSTAIAKETLTLVKWEHLEENWETVELPCINLPSELLKGHGRGRYQNVRQITFLTPEAKRDLISYKEWIEQRMGRKMTKEDNVWRDVNSPHEPITMSNLGWIIWDLARKAGVAFSWHDARRYVETALEEIRINPNWARKIRGRKVRGEESPYSQPAIEQLREKYREAVSLLEFTVEKPTVTKEMVKDEVLKALEDEKLKPIADKYHLTLEQVKTMMREKKMDVEELKELLKSRTATNGGCSNGEHCQRVVSESELETLLAEGWRAVMSLGNGKVVVETA
jgi:hypothetical protein